MKTAGLRKPERPILRLHDDVEEGLRTMGFKTQRVRALNRDEWSKITREAKFKLKGRDASKEGEEEQKTESTTIHYVIYQ